MDDAELLQRYAGERSESAFTEFVRRHVDLVFSAALRQTHGDAHRAEDIAQAVFTEAARQAAGLARHPAVVGWLYTTTRRIAGHEWRAGQRRSHREHEAEAMNQLLNEAGTSPDWEQLKPVLDEAMHDLSEADREAVLLRYFERRPLAEVGAKLGVSENAARMRVERALERLQGHLVRRGVSSATGALVALLTGHAVVATSAPVALRMSRRALARAAAPAGLAWWLLQLVRSTGFKWAAAVALLLGVSLLLVLRPPARTDASQSATPPDEPPPAPASLGTADAVPPSVEPAPIVSAPEPDTRHVLRLEIVAADTGEPLAGVPVECRHWQRSGFNRLTNQTTRAGLCEVSFDPDLTTHLELTTRIDGFADTRLRWSPRNGESIPSHYTVRLTRPVRISGRVVDAEGRPVIGASVGFNHESDPAAELRPEDHEFGWIEVPTDAEGRWTIHRITSGMIRRLYGSARQSDHVNSVSLFVARDSQAEAQLREGTHEFRLGHALVLRGTVADADGAPVSGARLLVGTRGESGARSVESRPDGSFEVAGCKPGQNLVTAEAEGYAPATLRVDLSGDTGPVSLTLTRGKTLILCVVDTAGRPVPGAQVWLNTRTRTFGMRQAAHEPIQASFSPKTDAEGRAVWTNAPDAELSFDFHATGFMRVNDFSVRPDGQEHRVTLPPGLIITGTVCDANSRQPLPRFRVLCGWPSGQEGVHWSTIDRFWLNFSGGKFRHSFEEGVISSTPNPGYVLKFMAEGYAPVLTRTITAEEGEVHLDVALRPAATLTATAVLPNGRPAAGADVGLVAEGARLAVTPGGLARPSGGTVGSHAVLRADANGRFQFAPDDAVTGVVVAHPDGYAEVEGAFLAGEAVVRLKPWGRVEGVCTTVTPAVTNRMLLQFAETHQGTLALDFQTFVAETDARGRFTFPKTPPGRHRILFLIPSSDSGRTVFTHWPAGEVEVRPGETAPVEVSPPTMGRPAP